MAELFGHEKLKAYEKSLGFVGLRSELLARIDHRVAACDHLDRGAESILLNIAHAGSSWSPKDRIVYLGHAALRFVGWVESRSPKLSCSTDVLAKLDKSSTAIILNIAEGNGRFSGADHVKFLRIAYKATIQSASLVDVAIAGRSFAGDPMQEGLEMLRQIAAMLTSLAKAVSKDT